MSREEAEPPADRNHDNHFGIMEQLFPVQDDVFALSHAELFSDGPSSFASGQYGFAPGFRVQRRSRRVNPYPTQETTTVLRFPVQPPGQWGELEREHVASQEGATFTEDASQGGVFTQVEQTQLDTLTAIGAVSSEIVSALLNIPDMGLGDWHEMRARHRANRARARAPRPATRPRSASGTGPTRTRRR